MVTTAVRPQTPGELLRSSLSVGAAGFIKIIPHILLGIGLLAGWIYTLLVVLTGSGSFEFNPTRLQALMAYGKTAFLVSIPFAIVGLILTCAVWGRVASVLTGQDMSVGESLRLGVSRWWPYFWANAILIVATIMGSLTLALVGGVLSVAMTLGLTFLMLVFGSIYHAAVVLEGNGPISGLRRCCDLVLPHMGHAAGSFLLVFLVGIGLSLGAKTAGSLVGARELLELVIEVAVSMLFLAAAIVIHADLKSRNAPPEADEELELSPV